jgi:DNA ligase D-like protein (predicted ligase)
MTAAADSTPSWAEPQLATLTRERFSGPDWIVERKLDAERCLAFAGPDGVRLMTRNKKDITSTFPEIAEALEARRHGGFVVDGEIVAFDGDQTRFGLLQQRLGVRQPSAESLRSVPAYFYVFDVLFDDGRDVRDVPLRERKELLAGLLEFRDPLRFTRHRERDGESYWEQACHDGWEGLIAKRADAPYRGGRGRDWLKFKCENAQEFVIGGWTDPQRSRVGLGALLLGYYQDGELRYAGKVGTGFDTRTLRELRSRLDELALGSPPFADRVRERAPHWARPELVAQIGFTEWTRDGMLRHPRYLGLRHDKPAREVVREVPRERAGRQEERTR